MPTTSGELRRAPTTTSGSSACTATRVNAPSSRRHTCRIASARSAADGELLGEQMRDDLGVGLGVQVVPALGQLGPQRGEVLDDPVVDDGDPSGVVEVRVGVGVGRAAVRGPPRVPDARSSPAGSGRSSSAFSRLTSLPGLLGRGQPAVGEHGDTRRVVSPVLQPLSARRSTTSER